MWKKLLKIGVYGLAVKQIADQVVSVRDEYQTRIRRRRNKDLAVGASVGAAIGSTAAFLLTPRTGGQARRALVRQAGETLEHLRPSATGRRERSAGTPAEEVRRAKGTC